MFEEIYSENYATMIRVASKMVGNRDDVSDIVQEVFINLLDKLNNGQVIHQPKSWLYRATYNKCVDNFRKQNRFRSVDSAQNYKVDDELLEKQESRNIIHQALSKLKPQEKALAVLYSEGLSYKEISEATGIKFSSIGKMLSRTLKKLEKELNNRSYELY